MKIVADESVDKQIVEALRNVGYTVMHIAEFEPALSDQEVLTKANEESALLVTADKDFGELVFRQARVHAGVILIRLPGVASFEKSDIVTQAFHNHERQMAGNFCVIGPENRANPAVRE